RKQARRRTLLLLLLIPDPESRNEPRMLPPLRHRPHRHTDLCHDGESLPAPPARVQPAATALPRPMAQRHTRWSTDLNRSAADGRRRSFRSEHEKTWDQGKAELSVTGSRWHRAVRPSPIHVPSPAALACTEAARLSRRLRRAALGLYCRRRSDLVAQARSGLRSIALEDVARDCLKVAGKSWGGSLGRTCRLTADTCDGLG